MAQTALVQGAVMVEMLVAVVGALAAIRVVVVMVEIQTVLLVVEEEVAAADMQEV
jgi:hypothetical protein